jgi:hypothetical protein
MADMREPESADAAAKSLDSDSDFDDDDNAWSFSSGVVRGVGFEDVLEKLISNQPKHQREDAPRLLEVMKRCMNAYYARHSLVTHQIASANEFYVRMLPQIVQENSCVVLNSPEGCRHVIRFGRTMLPRPRHTEADREIRAMTPHEARLRGLT